MLVEPRRFGGGGERRGGDATLGRMTDWAALRTTAHQMTARSYAPYSKFQVGAAALADDGRLVRGCNVENASFGVTLCAECGLISDLVAGGGGRLVACCCVDREGTVIMPCGRCRQLLWEHGGPQMQLLTPAGVQTMAQVLPQAFDATTMDYQ